MKKIYIIDVTNRDGVQTSRICLAKLEKTMINYFLDQMGIFQSEFGFPTTNHEKNYIDANVELKKLGVFKNIVLSGWLRATTEDVKQAMEKTKITDLNISISTSEQMLRGKFGGKFEFKEIIKLMVDALLLAKKAI